MKSLLVALGTIVAGIAYFSSLAEGFKAAPDRRRANRGCLVAVAGALLAIGALIFA